MSFSLEEFTNKSFLLDAWRFSEHEFTVLRSSGLLDSGWKVGTGSSNLLPAWIKKHAINGSEEGVDFYLYVYKPCTTCKLPCDCSTSCALKRLRDIFPSNISQGDIAFWKEEAEQEFITITKSKFKLSRLFTLNN